MVATRTLTLLLFAAVISVCYGQRKSAAKPRTTPPPQYDDEQYSDECPEPNGFFADSQQCDKYYACEDGKISERLCPDGMVFNDYSPKHEKCDLPFGIDCSQRPKLQEPQPSMHCRRKNGYFQHEDEKICDKFYYCVDGKFNMITCPDGLVYSEKTGICTWPDEAKKKGCTSEDVFQFQCPKTNETGGSIHPRYADPDDCQFFYVCINGEIPRRNGCQLGKVFNDVSKNCDSPKNVADCADWYKGRLTDEEIDRLNRPKPVLKPEVATANKRRRPSNRPSRPAASHEEDDA